ISGLNGVNYLTNENIMDLTVVPDHLVVLGAGYIGLEFGQMFRRFGSKVTVVQNRSQIVPREEPEIAAELESAFAAEGIRFMFNARTTQAEEKDGTIALTVEQGDTKTEVSGSHVLVATGRRPNTEELDLDKSGVVLNSDSTIKVNNKLETSVPGIW